jgi:hypothetical protein
MSRRPPAITALSIFDIVAGGVLAGGTVALCALILREGREAFVPSLLFLVMWGLPGVLLVQAGVRLRRLAPAGRTLQMVIAALGLVLLPFGTVASLLFFVYFTRPGAVALFFGGSTVLAHHGEPAPPPSGAWIYAALVAIVLQIAAVAWFLVEVTRYPRISASESMSIGDIRTVLSAEEQYRSANGGHYDTIACLQAPKTCIPGYGADPPVFLDPSFGNEERHGYIFEFHPGPTPAARDTARTSPSSRGRYAYTARPKRPGRTGIRAFCGDSGGRICFWPGGTVPPISDGVCPADCTTLQ